MGGTALIFTGFMTALIGFYVLFTGRRVDPRPEDDPDGEIADIAGEYGFYSPHCWWPLPLGISAAVAALGFVFGWWMIVLGGFLIILSVDRPGVRALPRRLRALAHPGPAVASARAARSPPATAPTPLPPGVALISPVGRQSRPCPPPSAAALGSGPRWRSAWWSLRAC